MYEFCEQFAKDLANLSNEQVLIRRKQIHSLMMDVSKKEPSTFHTIFHKYLRNVY